MKNLKKLESAGVKSTDKSLVRRETSPSLLIMNLVKNRQRQLKPCLSCLVVQGGFLMVTWVLCANQSDAKLFECRKLNERLRFIKNFPNSEGHLRPHEIESDREGSKAGGGSSFAMHGVSPHEGPKMTIASRFARSLNHELEKSDDEGGYDSLVICADPKFLGILKAALSKRVEKKVIGTVSQNYYLGSDEPPVLAQLRQFVEDANVLKMTQP